MPCYKKILVAIDCSPVDDTVIEHLMALAVPLGATLHLLHVVHSHTRDQERYLREQAVTTLEGYRATLRAAGIATEVLIRSGEPEHEIPKEVEEHGYDLLAMAIHGHNLPCRILFGSVSRSIRQKITIPLLLVTPPR